MLTFVCVELQVYLYLGVRVWRSDYSSWELVLSCHLVGSRDQTQVSGLHIRASIFKLLRILERKGEYG